MAPEYALWGYLSFKADVYSYGVLVLEIVAGISNSSFMAAGDDVCLLEWVIFSQVFQLLIEAVFLINLFLFCRLLIWKSQGT